MSTKPTSRPEPEQNRYHCEDCRIPGKSYGIRPYGWGMEMGAKVRRWCGPCWAKRTATPTTAPDSEMDPFEAADDIDRRWGS